MGWRGKEEVALGRRLPHLGEAKQHELRVEPPLPGLIRPPGARFRRDADEPMPVPLNHVRFAQRRYLADPCACKCAEPRPPTLGGGWLSQLTRPPPVG